VDDKPRLWTYTVSDHEPWCIYMVNDRGRRTHILKGFYASREAAQVVVDKWKAPRKPRTPGGPSLYARLRDAKPVDWGATEYPPVREESARIHNPSQTDES
jgi:hypothetical protein